MADTPGSSSARSGADDTGAARRELRYLALGDSYTIGEAVPAAGSWPAQLVGLARERGMEIAEPEIVATTGWTTDELEAGIDAASPAGAFDVVTLLIGVNDQYRGRDAASYRAGFERLLRRAVEFAGGRPGRVIVASIPDWGVTPFAADRDAARIAAEIDAFNAVNRAAAVGAGARYVDVTPVSRRRGADPGMLAPDGLHPSAAMYAEWAALTLPVLLDLLAAR